MRRAREISVASPAFVPRADALASYAHDFLLQKHTRLWTQRLLQTHRNPLQCFLLAPLGCVVSVTGHATIESDVNALNAAGP